MRSTNLKRQDSTSNLGMTIDPNILTRKEQIPWHVKTTQLWKIQKTQTILAFQFQRDKLIVLLGFQHILGFSTSTLRPWPEPICTLPTSPGSHHVAWGNQLSGTDFSTHRELLVRNPHHDCLGGITGITDHFLFFWDLGPFFSDVSWRGEMSTSTWWETMVAVFP